MFTLSNSNLPATILSPFNLSAPILSAQGNQTLAPLFQTKTFHKYPGVNPSPTELTTPDAVFTLYKINLPFLAVLRVGINNFIQATNPDRLTGQRFYLQKTTVYFATNTVPDSINLTIEFNAPIPRVMCELIVSVPSGMIVSQVLNRGVPLNFGQVGERVVIDCSNSCCRIRGGETLEMTGQYTAPQKLIGQLNVFDIGEDLGFIDYVEWRGRRFVEPQGEFAPGQFFWDEAIQSLKLIT